MSYELIVLLMFSSMMLLLTGKRVFGGYFPVATRYSLNVPVLLKQYGLNEIWAEEWATVEAEALKF